MEYIQQEINMHKTKLFNFINSLINTQLITEELFFYNEIMKVCQFLNSLLNIKQNTLINQNNFININNPMLFQPNMEMNNIQPNMNMNQLQKNEQQIYSNFDKDNNTKSNKIINISFYDCYSGMTVVQCPKNEKICDLIEKYRKKANNYKDSFFLYNLRDLNKLGNFVTVDDVELKNGSTIQVLRKHELMGAFFIILNEKKFK